MTVTRRQQYSQDPNAHPFMQAQRNFQHVASNRVPTDKNGQRIGQRVFTYDGSNRLVEVEDIENAADE